MDWNPRNWFTRKPAKVTARAVSDAGLMALKLSGETVDEKAQANLNAFIAQLHGPFTVNNEVPFDVIIAAMYIAIFLRGAVMSELVLNDAGNAPLELATPDPASLLAKRIDDPERGKVWQIGQRQRNHAYS
jgi:hypothetical protein